MRRAALVISLVAACSLFAATAFAQFGLIQSGIDAMTKGKSSQGAPAAPGANPAVSANALKQETTFKNPARNFEFTIPAGWEMIEGDPASESCGFRNMANSQGFLFHIEQMVPSFPAKSAVSAGLKQDKERVTIKKLLSAERRDDGNPKKKCGVIGWQIVEAPQKNSFERIIWQCYDGENYYMNFNAYSDNDEFAAARPVLEKIMKSIKFCK